MNALQWLNSLRPALPMSVETPGKLLSNGELKRHMQQGGVLVNGEKVAPDESIDFPLVDVTMLNFVAQPNKK